MTSEGNPSLARRSWRNSVVETVDITLPLAPMVCVVSAKKVETLRHQPILGAVYPQLTGDNRGGVKARSPLNAGVVRFETVKV
jgi:hypothetical protein